MITVNTADKFIGRVVCKYFIGAQSETVALHGQRLQLERGILPPAYHTMMKRGASRQVKTNCEVWDGLAMMDAVVIHNVPQAGGVRTAQTRVENRIVQPGDCAQCQGRRERVDRRAAVIESTGGTARGCAGGRRVSRAEDAASQTIRAVGG